MNTVQNKKSGRMEIRTLLTLILLALPLLISSTLVIHRSILSYKQSTASKRLDNAIEPLLSFCMDFMFVRGRLNVTLSRTEAISIEDLDFIEQRALRANTNILEGSSALSLINEKAASNLIKTYNNTLELKTLAIFEAKKPMAQRYMGLRQNWFEESSMLIELIIDTLSVASLNTKSNEPSFSLRWILLQIINFRDYFGIEASMVTSLMELDRRPGITELNTIINLEGRQIEIWKQVEFYVNGIDIPELKTALADLKERSFGNYRQLLSESKMAIIENRTTPVKPKELSALSVIALDSIAGFVDAVFVSSAQNTAKIMKNAIINLATGFFILLWALLVIFLVPILLRKKVFAPFYKVLQKLSNACEQNVSSLEQKDEIAFLGLIVNKLINKSKEEQKKSKEFRKLADLDSLTGLLNRRAFLEECKLLRERMEIENIPWSMALFDLDHFKNVNDTWGHFAGDMALKHFAAILLNGLRSTDLACRYGGEEFMVFLANTNSNSSFTILERIRINLEQNNLDWEGKTISITSSIGVYNALHSDTIDLAIQKADEALYTAKLQGRNRTILTL